MTIRIDPNVTEMPKPIPWVKALIIGAAVSVGREHAYDCAWLDFGECSCRIKPGTFNDVGEWITNA